MIVNPDVHVYSLRAKKHEKIPKNAKNNNLLKTKRILNINMQAQRGPGYYIYLARRSIAPVLRQSRRYFCPYYPQQNVHDHCADFHHYHSF